MFENFTVVQELSKFDFTFHSLQWGFSKLTATDYFHRYTQYRSVQSAGPKFGFWECRIQYSWPNMVGLCSTGQLERLRAGFPQKMFCSPCRGALFLPKTVHPCKGRKKIFCSPPAGVHCFCPRQCRLVASGQLSPSTAGWSRVGHLRTGLSRTYQTFAGFFNCSKSCG